MDGRKERLNNILFFLAAFLVGGLLHVAVYSVSFLKGFSQFYYSIFALLWGRTILRRIIDRRVRRLMLAMCVSMVAYFTLQICKYTFFGFSAAASRYLWYGYYIPMMAIPLLLLFISLYMNLPETEAPSRLWLLTILPAGAIILSFMTNDLHTLVFSFPSGIMEDNNTVYGPLYIVFWGYIVAVMIAALGIIIKKCHMNSVIKYLWLPILPLAAGILWLVFEVMDFLPPFGGIRLWNMGEVFSFTFLGCVEACICVGLIPSNSGYEWLFHQLSFPAEIIEASGKTVFATACNSRKSAGYTDMQIYSVPITGGTVRWTVDTSAVMALNRQLKDATEKIEARNDFLQTQNAQRAEQTSLEARNKVYDRIADIIAPQAEMIRRMAETEAFEEHLAELTVYYAYIKRRCNLELIRGDNPTLPIKELIMAVAESLEYLKLCGVQAVLYPTADGDYDAGAVILAYEFFEYALECLLPGLKMLSVYIGLESGQLSLRMLANKGAGELDSRWREQEAAATGGKISVSAEEDDCIIVLSFGKDGERV